MLMPKIKKNQQYSSIPSINDSKIAYVQEQNLESIMYMYKKKRN